MNNSNKNWLRQENRSISYPNQLMQTTLTAKDWQTIAIQAMQKNETLKAEVNMLRAKRAVYNGVEMQLAMISALIPLTK